VLDSGKAQHAAQTQFSRVFCTRLNRPSNAQPGVTNRLNA
jgi:hypothetical protein